MQKSVKKKQMQVFNIIFNEIEHKIISCLLSNSITGN